MTRTTKTTTAAALAAIALAGFIPGAALAQVPRGGAERKNGSYRPVAPRPSVPRDLSKGGAIGRVDNGRPGMDRRADREEAERRQKTKNDWRNLAIGAGGALAFGLIQRDPTIAFAGAAGALYSLHRYEQDRKSQDALARARSGIFSQDHFYRDGRRYERETVTRDGQRYYRFVRR